MRPSRLILLVILAIAVMLCGTVWLVRGHKAKADVLFQPLARVTGADGSTQQAFAVSNLTGSTVEYVLGR